MKKIVGLLIILIFVITLSSCQEPEVNPFELDIVFYNQERTLMNLTDNEKRAIFEGVVFYESAISFESQFLSLQSNDTFDDPLDLRFSNIITRNYIDTLDFRSFEEIDLNTIGYEQLIDTGGLSGRLKLFLQLFDNFTDTYFTSKIELSNPPFRITAEENQVMTTTEATFELPVLLDFSIEITPETLIGFIEPQITLLQVHEMEYGHYLTVPITIDNIIQDVSINAQIELIIVEGFIVYATITSQLASLIIPVNGLIENTEALDVSLTIDILLDFLYTKDDLLLPDETELSTYERVDAFSLPDVASIFG
ncbi:MAG: hypothetical protein O2987_01890 [Firmicutes bacterium]|nr:hypothetical protein [Bacillota bacterium]